MGYAREFTQNFVLSLSLCYAIIASPLLDTERVVYDNCLEVKMKKLKLVFFIIVICLWFLFGCSSPRQGDNTSYNGGDLSNFPAQKVSANEIQSAKQRLINSTAYLFPAEQTNSNILDNWNFPSKLKETANNNSFSLQLYFDLTSSPEIYKFNGSNKVSCSPVNSEDVYLSTYKNGQVVQYSKNGKDITNGDTDNDSYLSTKEGFAQCLDTISKYLLESIANAKDYEPNDKNQYIFYVVRHFDENSEQKGGNGEPVYFSNEAAALEDLKSTINTINDGSGEDGANYYASFVFKYTLEFVGDYLKYEKIDYGMGFDDNANPTSIIWHESPYIEAHLTEYGTTEI